MDSVCRTTNNITSKALRITVYSTLSLLIFTVSVLLSVTLCERTSGLFVGIALMLFSFFFHILGKKKSIFYNISFVANSFANGLSASALYLTKGPSFNAQEALVSFLSVIFIHTAALWLIVAFKDKLKIILSVVATLFASLLIGSVILWIAKRSFLFSFAFFLLVLAAIWICLIAFTLTKTNRVLLRDISFAGFGAFILTTIIVIVIISEGDVLDGADIDVPNKNKKSAISDSSKS